jgi:hypothetical protein
LITYVSAVVIFKIATDLHEHRWCAPPSKKSHTTQHTNTSAYTHTSVTPAPPQQTAHLPSFTLPFAKTPKLGKKSEEKPKIKGTTKSGSTNNNNGTETELVDADQQPPAHPQDKEHRKKEKTSEFKFNIPLLGKLQL